MKSKAQIGAERAALDQQVHGAATRAFHSAQRHELVKQGPARDALKAECAEVGGHVYAPQTGKCKYCGVSNDTTPKLATFSSADQRGRPIAEGEVFQFYAAPGTVSNNLVLDSGPIRIGIRPSPAPQPSTDISSKGADALPVTTYGGMLVRTGLDGTEYSSDDGATWELL